MALSETSKERMTSKTRRDDKSMEIQQKLFLFIRIKSHSSHLRLQARVALSIIDSQPQQPAAKRTRTALTRAGRHLLNWSGLQLQGSMVISRQHEMVVTTS